MAPAQKPPKKVNSKTKMGKKETTMEKKTTKEKKKTSVEKRETTMEKKETSVEKRETTMEKKETSVEKREGPIKKLKQRKHKRESYASYIYRVLKQVHPYTEMSKQAMSIMDSFMQDMFERIAAESSSLIKNNGRKVLSSQEVQTAVRLIFPGELSKHATIEGAKALQNYEANK